MEAGTEVARAAAARAVARVVVVTVVGMVADSVVAVAEARAGQRVVGSLAVVEMAREALEVAVETAAAMAAGVTEEAKGVARAV